MPVAESEVLAESWPWLMPVLFPLAPVLSGADVVGLACAVADGLPLPDGDVLALAE